jgi:hypothetical protein
MNGNAVIIFHRTIQGEMKVSETMGKLLYEEFINKLGRPLTEEEAELLEWAAGNLTGEQGEQKLKGTS